MQVEIHCSSRPEPLPYKGLKVQDKSQINIRQTEPKYSDANSRSFNVQPHLRQYQCCVICGRRLDAFYKFDLKHNDY